MKFILLLIVVLFFASVHCITLTEAVAHVRSRLTYLDTSNGSEAYLLHQMSALQQQITTIDITEHKLIVAVILIGAVGLAFILVTMIFMLCLLAQYRQRHIGRKIETISESTSNDDELIPATYACQTLFPPPPVQIPIEDKI